MQRPDHSDIDWTGVQPDRSPIAPLDAYFFAERLRRLSERATSLMILRNAFTQQQSHGERFSQDPESPSRQSR